MRADLGAALLHNPPVIYLDEPTIGLDIVVKDNIRNAIKEINEKYNTTVVLTTHDIGDIEELCDRIIIIDAGKKIYDGSLEDLLNIYGTHRKVILEVKNLDKVRNLSLDKILKVKKDDYEITADDANNTLSVSFDKTRMNVSDVIENVMKETEVKDIKIVETELADIVKKIYKIKFYYTDS